MKNTKIVKRLLALLVLSMTYGTASGQNIDVVDGIRVGETQTNKVCGGDDIYLSISGLPSDKHISHWDLDNAPDGVSLQYESMWEGTENWVKGLPNGESVTVKVQLLKSDGNEWKWISQTIYNIKPAEISFGGTEETTCNGTADLKCNAQTGFSYKWSTQSAGVIECSTCQNASISSIPAGQSANVSLKVFKNGFEEQCSQEGSITITNNQVDATLDGMPTNIYVCNDNYPLTAETPIDGATGIWTSSDAVSFDNETSCCTVVRGISVNGNILTWTVTKGGCSDFKTINITNASVSEAQITSSNETVYIPTVQLNAVEPNHGHQEYGTWSVVGDKGDIILICPSCVNNSPVTGLSNGPNTFRWTIANDHCSNFKDVVITYIAPVITAPSEVCGDVVEVSVTEPPAHYYTGEWSCNKPYVRFLNSSSCTTTVSNLTYNMYLTLT